MTKQEFKINLEQAIQTYELGLSKDDIEFIAELAYDEKNPWYYNDFTNLCSTISSEWGDLIYALSQFDLIPDLIEQEVYVRDWVAEHRGVIGDILAYAKVDSDYEYAIMQVDIETIINWLTDHEQAYKDCISYVHRNKK